MLSMQITVNDASHDCADSATVADVIIALGLSTKRVAVEVNRTLVPRAQHAEHVLQANDQVEVVTLVGGG